MRYLVGNSFTQIDLDAGTIQNTSALNTVEISDTNQTNSGFLLFPSKSVTFNGGVKPIYLRSVTPGIQISVVVIPLLLHESSQNTTQTNNVNLATDEETNAMLNDILGG